MSPDSLDIMRLGLVGRAALAAAAFAKAHADCEFTSGRRTTHEQAHAMAENIVLAGRRWIVDTYKPSPISAACQRWVNAHPKARSIDAIAAGLFSVFARFTDAELGALSKHLSGEAFDVKPVDGHAGTIMLMDLRYTVESFGGTLLEREGGLLRWHCQF